MQTLYPKKTIWPVSGLAKPLERRHLFTFMALTALMMCLTIFSISILAAELWAAKLPDSFGDPTKPASEPGNIAQVERHLKNVVKAKGVQLELPLKSQGDTSSEMEPIEAPVSIAKIFVIIAAIISAFLVTATIVKHIRLKRRKNEQKLREEKEKEKEREVLQKALVTVREDSDKLASQGLYGLAMHELLINSLEEYKKRDISKIRNSATNRELMRTLPMNQEGVRAFCELVVKVEPVYFGNRKASWEDYEESKEIYANLLLALDATRNGGAGRPHSALT
ncbi:MAG: hypothetical protein LBE38_07590 [Deltaproteobacteria bacterium]|jgi:hypothetical protein|nr:hypothetical protein [Deltaproteobacteria bacterium]